MPKGKASSSAAEDKLRERPDSDWIPAIYLRRVRSQRTRSVRINVPQKENDAEIQYTLLGIELKAGKSRFSCPDLATARYMRVFARLGCREFAIPYNITKISVIADELETAWHRLGLLVEDKAVRKAVIKTIRGEIASIGAGEEAPEFNTAASRRGFGKDK